MCAVGHLSGTMGLASTVDDETWSSSRLWMTPPWTGFLSSSAREEGGDHAVGEVERRVVGNAFALEVGECSGEHHDEV